MNCDNTVDHVGRLFRCDTYKMHWIQIQKFCGSGLRKSVGSSSGNRETDIKFCRRVGPKGDRPRPLVIGFYSLATRNAAVRMDLRSLEQDLSIGPDLTRKQREEEARIWKEMEEKNQNRSAEEKAKNLQ
jgi:hypothetical protein